MFDDELNTIEFPTLPGQTFLDAVASRLEVQLGNYGLAGKLGFRGAMDAKVAEIGAWDGRYLPMLAKLGPREIFAIEPDNEQIQIAIDKGLIDDVHALRTRVEEVPQKHLGTFDVAFCFNVAPDTNDVDGFINGIGSLLKPGGQAVLTMEDARHNWWLDKLRAVFDVSSAKQFKSLHEFLVICTKRL